MNWYKNYLLVVSQHLKSVYVCFFFTSYFASIRSMRRKKNNSYHFGCIDLLHSGEFESKKNFLTALCCYDIISSSYSLPLLLFISLSMAFFSLAFTGFIGVFFSSSRSCFIFAFWYFRLFRFYSISWREPILFSVFCFFLF